MKKNFTLWLLVAGLFVFSANIIAQDSNAVKTKNQIKTKTNNGKQTEKMHGHKFVDEDGDGYNDNAPDDDGDGIPNGLDEDYMGSGKKGFVDLDGDGINDNASGAKNARRGIGMGKNKNQNSVRPQNGNVSGAGNNDGSGNSGETGRVRKGKGGKGN